MIRLIPSVSLSVKRAASSREPEEGAAGEKLLAYVQQKIDGEVAAAGQFTNSGQSWKAYKALTALVERFRGYDLPDGTTARIHALKEDAVVSVELAAARQLAAARKMAANPCSRVGAISRLKMLVEEKPDTEAGREAQRILSRLNTP